MYSQVYSVQIAVIMAATKKLPPDLQVFARGCVSSTGWSDPQLVVRQYETPPQDGILDVHFVAKPPAPGVITNPTLRGIEVTQWIRDVPRWYRGVRVHASTNHVMAVPASDADKGAPEDAAATDAARADRGDAFPWTLPLIEPGPRKEQDLNLAMPVKELLGRRVRILRDGEVVTQDYVPDRVNIVKARFSEAIHDIYFG